MGRVVLFGATGFTGRLTAGALLGRGIVPVLAGRSAARLSALAGELAAGQGSAGVRPETVELDAGRPWQLAPLLEPDDVLVTTVGPFARVGRPAVEAAVAAGAAYLDSTGEPPFLAAVFAEQDAAARRTGARLLPAFGYDYVPGNLAAALALREAGTEATRVLVGYFLTGITGRGAFSKGTVASAAGVLGEPAPVLREGRLVPERPAARGHAFDLAGRRRRGVSIGASEHHVLPRAFPQLREVGVFLGWADRLSPAVQLGSAALAVAGRIPAVGAGVRTGLRLGVDRLPVGARARTGDESSGRGGTLVVAEARTAADELLARVVVTGPDPYDLTAGLLAWAAQQARDGRLRGTGVLGPVDAFGLDELEAGCRELGLARTEGL